jgi:hypothetical protein
MFGRALARAEASFANLGHHGWSAQPSALGRDAFLDYTDSTQTAAHFEARDSALSGAGKRRILATPRDAERSQRSIDAHLSDQRHGSASLQGDHLPIGTSSAGNVENRHSATAPGSRVGWSDARLTLREPNNRAKL